MKGSKDGRDLTHDNVEWWCQICDWYGFYKW